MIGNENRSHGRDDTDSGENSASLADSSVNASRACPGASTPSETPGRAKVAANEQAEGLRKAEADGKHPASPRQTR